MAKTFKIYTAGKMGGLTYSHVKIALKRFLENLNISH